MLFAPANQKKFHAVALIKVLLDNSVRLTYNSDSKGDKNVRRTNYKNIKNNYKTL